MPTISSKNKTKAIKNKYSKGKEGDQSIWDYNHKDMTTKNKKKN